MAAFQTRVLKTTFEVREDLSESQFLGVTLDTDEKIGLPAADGDLCVGILQEDPLDEEYGGVMVYGISKLVFAEAITAGQEVSIDANGKGKVAEAGEHTIGLCIVGAGIDERGSVLIDRTEVNDV